MSKNKIFGTFLLVICILLFVGTVVFTVSHNSLQETDQRHIDLYESYSKICIDNHVYYEGSNIHQLTIKLNDDGTPVKCKKQL